MSDLRERFATTFGEHLAISIEAMIERHVPVLKISLERGSDPFRFALVWAVGLECLSRPKSREEHDVAVPWEMLHAWIRDADLLDGYDGTFDFSGRAAGLFDEILGEKTEEDYNAGVLATVDWLVATGPAARV